MAGLVSEPNQRFLRFSRPLTVEANQPDVRSNGLQDGEVVGLLLCDVLVHTAGTEASVISIPEANSLCFEASDSVLVGQPLQILVQRSPNKLPEIVAGIRV